MDESNSQSSMVKGAKNKTKKRKIEQSRNEKISEIRIDEKQICTKIDDLKLDRQRIILNILSNQVDLNKENTNKLYKNAVKMSRMIITKEKIENLLKLLSNYEYNTDNMKNKVKELMKNLGKELRQNLMLEKLQIIISSCGKEIISDELSPHSTVKDLKYVVISKIEIEDVTLIFNNQILEKKEYLIDYGILPSQINAVEVKIREKNVEKKFELKIKEVTLRLIKELRLDFCNEEKIIDLLKEIDKFVVSERLIHLLKPILVAQVHKITRFRSKIQEILKKFASYYQKENTNMPEIF